MHCFHEVLAEKPGAVHGFFHREISVAPVLVKVLADAASQLGPELGTGSLIIKERFLGRKWVRRVPFADLYHHAGGAGRDAEKAGQNVPEPNGIRRRQHPPALLVLPRYNFLQPTPDTAGRPSTTKSQNAEALRAFQHAL
jgi:hypothetical protein